MIEGLKVTVRGPELIDLCRARAAHHAEREATYAAQVTAMRNARVEAAQGSNGDPVAALESKVVQHRADGRELDFVADHIDPSETYLLDRDALRRIGIVADRY